ncbi:MAG: GNAT family N-acetyltransferase, partial [Parachlamydiaceae bacterium]
MPEITALDPSCLKEEKYRSMLLPSFKKYLDEDFEVKNLLLFSLNDPEPVSLIAIDHFPILMKAVLQSIYTLPERRRKGYATSLYAHAETYLKKLQINLITCNYPEEEADPKEADPFFQKIGFSKAKPLVTRYFVDIQEFRPHWFDTLPKMPPGYQIVPFSLTQEELNDIKIMVRQGTVSVEVNPLEDLPHEPINSLALRKEGKLIGWMVTKRANPSCISYTSFYIDRDLRGTGLASA